MQSDIVIASTGAPLIHFEAVLYSQDERALDHSHSYFVPGYFKFHT